MTMTPQQAKAYRSDPADAAIAAYDDERAAAAQVEGACSLLRPASPDTAAFCGALYGGASPEDVARYAPESLAALASLAYQRSRVRKTGQSLVDICDFHPHAGDHTLNEAVFVAVNDDMPFLFDSLMGELAVQNVRAHVLLHPIMQVKRDAGGLRASDGTPMRESVIVLVLDSVHDDAHQQALLEGARNVFAQVGLAVRDWRKMLAKLTDTIANLERRPPKIPLEELRENIAFLEWLGDNHFTFLGCRDYAFDGAGGGRLIPVEESGLGLLSDSAARVIGRGSDHANLSAEARAFLDQPEPLIITKANERSVVHRRVHMDYVGVKTFDSTGSLSGERRFVGLFTSGAYSRRPADIPLLRLKIAHIIERAGLAPDSHDGKALAHILDTYPRE
ncbi:MAG TPA: hypothetical protein VG274_00935, partial [Rhizomicrobium sp.]|nr:hypothetical protein [Rhizomicrobium sp.]